MLFGGTGMYHIDVTHDGLKKSRRLTGADQYVLEQRARVQTEAWEQRWRRRAMLDEHSDELLRHLPDFEAKKAHAGRLTNEAQRMVASLRNILLKGLEAAPFRMEMLYDYKMFPERRPVLPVDQDAPPEPDRSDPSFSVQEKYDVVGEFWALWLPRVRRKRDEAARSKTEAAQKRYELARRTWQETKHEIARLNVRAMALFELALDEWWERAQDYVKHQRDENAQIDRFRLRYAQGKPDAVIEFLDAVLAYSEYPDIFSMQWEMEFLPDSDTLIVDYELPPPEDFPTLKGVKYDVLRDTFEQRYLSAVEIAQLYDGAAYQTCLKVLHDVFAADEADVIGSVTFNGWVNFFDKVNGKPARACILSVQATKADIGQIDLSAVDPKTCFRTLKGVAGAKLTDMVAVAPVLVLKKADDRFMPANDVARRAEQSSTQSGSQDRA